MTRSPEALVYPVGVSASRWAFLAFLFVTAALIFILRLVYPVWLYADYGAYLLLLDNYARNPLFDWWRDEPASWGPMLFFRYLAGTTHGGIVIANWYLSAWYVLALYVLNRRYRIDWEGTGVLLLAFGALLAFVTIRATPAYFLICFAAFEAARARALPALALAFIACLFHLSAALAVPGIVIALLQSRLGFIDKALRSRVLLFVVGFGIVIPFILLQSILGDALQSLVNSVPLLDRFTAYVQGDTSQGLGPTRSIFHLIYSGIVTVSLVGYLVIAKDASNQLKTYLIVCFGVYLFLSFSPVSAYRFSIFFVMPLLLSFPWRRIALGGVTPIAVAIVSVVVFVTGFTSVLIR